MYSCKPNQGNWCMCIKLAMKNVRNYTNTIGGGMRICGKLFMSRIEEKVILFPEHYFRPIYHNLCHSMSIQCPTHIKSDSDNDPDFR